MSQINNNGMSRKAVATNNNNGVSANNNINNNQNIALVIPTDNSIEKFKVDITDMSKGLKNYCLVNGEEFEAIAKSKICKEFSVIVNGETYTCSVDKDELSGKYRLYMWWDSNLETVYKSHFDFKVMSGCNTAKVIAAMQEAILAASTFKQDEQDEQENDACVNCVLRYQSEFDGYMSDLHMVAENYADVTDRWTAMLVSDIIGRMAQLGSDLLESLGDITGCDMVEDDGYWLDTTDLCRWHGGTDDFYVDDMQDLVDTLNYMSTADSGLPLGLEQDSIDWIIAGEGNAYCGLQPLYTGETAYNFVMENV